MPTIDTQVVFPLTVHWDDELPEQFDSIGDIERQLEFWRGDNTFELPIFDATGKSVRVIVEALELLCMQVLEQPPTVSPLLIADAVDDESNEYLVEHQNGRVLRALNKRDQKHCEPESISNIKLSDSPSKVEWVQFDDDWMTSAIPKRPPGLFSWLFRKRK